MQIALSAARTLYRHLFDAGVCIHEYCERPFHGKVALIDDDWATVGSSNLDPLSLSLNLEANVFIRDAEFVQELRATHGRSAAAALPHRRCRGSPATRRFWQRLTRPLLFHFLRHFPTGRAGCRRTRRRRRCCGRRLEANAERAP